MPVNIKGKEYLTVAERIQEAHKKYPNKIEIDTTVLKMQEGEVCIKAIVTIHGQTTLRYSGIAHEKANSSYINNTSYIENCETSAIGRALSAAGFSGAISVLTSQWALSSAATRLRLDGPCCFRLQHKSRPKRQVHLPSIDIQTRRSLLAPTICLPPPMIAFLQARPPSDKLNSIGSWYAASSSSSST